MSKTTMTTPPQDSRQVARRVCFENALYTVQAKNPGMSRRDRRKLARAYAAGIWTKILEGRDRLKERATSAPRTKRMIPTFEVKR